MDSIMTNDILARLSVLEKSNIDWVALFIGIGSCVIALASVIQSYASRKDNNFNNIDNQITTAKMNCQAIAMQTSDTTDSPENKEIKRKQLNAAVELVLNAYENACNAFYTNKIRRGDFREKYHHDIRSYIEKYPGKFAPPLTMYSKMEQYYKEYHKK